MPCCRAARRRAARRARSPPSNIVNAGMVAGSALLCAGLLAAGTGVAGAVRRRRRGRRAAGGDGAAPAGVTKPCSRLCAWCCGLPTASRSRGWSTWPPPARGRSSRRTTKGSWTRRSWPPLLAGRVAFAVDVHQTPALVGPAGDGGGLRPPGQTRRARWRPAAYREVRRDRRAWCSRKAAGPRRAKLNKVYPGPPWSPTGRSRPIVPGPVSTARAQPPFSRPGRRAAARWFPKSVITGCRPRRRRAQVAVADCRGRSPPTGCIPCLTENESFRTSPRPSRPLSDELCRRRRPASAAGRESSRNPEPPGRLTRNPACAGEPGLGRRPWRARRARAKRSPLLPDVAVPTAAAFLGCQALAGPAMLKRTAGPPPRLAVDAARIRKTWSPPALVDKARRGSRRWTPRARAKNPASALYLEDVKGESVGSAPKLEAFATVLRPGTSAGAVGRGVDDPARVVPTSASEGGKGWC